ncbi:MAG: TlpA family protein disulfide reductase [Verrucomicrobia bacterium]|nr:TlpA family protein disulfide reductase [Verrucomicrobiota bacterium]
MKRRPFIQRSIAATISAIAVGISPSLFAAWKENAMMPALSGFGLEGVIPKTNGKVVYLDFLASWCAPCKASFPVLSTWHNKYSSKGFMVLGVNVDDDAAAMQAFLKKNNPGFPSVRDAQHKLVAAADVKTMPTSFLIDRKGVIRAVHNGFHPKDEAALSAKIESLLAES